MITRPLDLASRLTPPPRSRDGLFFVNVGLLVFFFFICGSRFVLAPGLGLGFQLPQVVGARAGAAATTATLSILPSGQILTRDGPVTSAQLPEWLRRNAQQSAHPILLIIASQDVPSGEFLKLVGLAKEAGFASTVMAAEERPVGGY
jgi:biopolymer transport protein ExbD